MTEYILSKEVLQSVNLYQCLVASMFKEGWPGSLHLLQVKYTVIKMKRWR